MTATPETALTHNEAADKFESLLTAEDGDNQTDSKTPVDGETEPDEDQEDAENPQPEEPEPDEDNAVEEGAEIPQTHTVTLPDGTRAQVQLSELKDGFLRQSDYTRKVQEVAEKRKSADSDLAAARAEREHYAQQLEAVDQLLRQAAQEPNWDQLLNENPTEFVKQRYLYEQHQKRLQAVENERWQIHEKQQAETAKQAAERLAEESRKLTEVIPEWKNTKTQKAEKAQLVDFAIHHGYQPEDLAEINDSRVVVLLRKAMLFDQMTAKKATLKPQHTQTGPKPVQPGSAARQSTVSESTRHKQRLAKTHDIIDAAKVFEDMI